MIKTIQNVPDFNKITETEDAVLIYFSHEKCNVCKVLKPKVAEMLDEYFPKMRMYYSDTVEMPEIAGQNSIFTVPAVLIFFTGKEYFRYSRNISIDVLKEQIQRPYTMIFE